MAREIVIDERFHGPPGSAHGGYVCGCLSRFLDSTGAVVRLHQAPPLATPMKVRDTDAGVALWHAGVAIAEARPAEVTLEPPAPPSFQEAEDASRRFAGFAAHVFPTCFVCGPERRVGDGLRIFPGPLDGEGRVASPWVPDASLAPRAGRVAPEFLWAALDCPGAFAFDPPPEGVVLLGELQAELWGHVSEGERCVLLAWELDREERKHRTATALFGESGACRGIGIGVWIEVAEESSPSGAGTPGAPRVR